MEEKGIPMVKKTMTEEIAGKTKRQTVETNTRGRKECKKESNTVVYPSGDIKSSDLTVRKELSRMKRSYNFFKYINLRKHFVYAMYSRSFTMLYETKTNVFSSLYQKGIMALILWIHLQNQ